VKGKKDKPESGKLLVLLDKSLASPQRALEQRWFKREALHWTEMAMARL
jgi:hypothetical protein